MQLRPPGTSNIELALKREHRFHFFSMTPKSYQNDLPNAPIWHPKTTTIGSKGHPVTILDPLGGQKKRHIFEHIFGNLTVTKMTPKSEGAFPKVVCYISPPGLSPLVSLLKGTRINTPPASLTSRRFQAFVDFLGVGVGAGGVRG